MDNIANLSEVDFTTDFKSIHSPTSFNEPPPTEDQRLHGEALDLARTIPFPISARAVQRGSSREGTGGPGACIFVCQDE